MESLISYSTERNADANRHHSLDQFDQYLKGLTVRDGYNFYNNLPEL